MQGRRMWSLIRPVAPVLGAVLFCVLAFHLSGLPWERGPAVFAWFVISAYVVAAVTHIDGRW